MAWTEEILRRRARRAYELGRLRRALAGAWPAAPLTAVGLAGCGAATIPTLLAGLLLAATLTACAQRGGGLARARVPGLLAGLVPLTLTLAAPTLALALGDGCASTCRLLTGICVAGGLVAGALLALVARGGALVAALAVAGLTGALGCGVLGLAGLAGVGGGLAVGAAPGLVRWATR
jgi:hypothetical protein